MAKRSSIGPVKGAGLVSSTWDALSECALAVTVPKRRGCQLLEYVRTPLSAAGHYRRPDVGRLVCGRPFQAGVLVILSATKRDDETRRIRSNSARMGFRRGLFGPQRGPAIGESSPRMIWKAKIRPMNSVWAQSSVGLWSRPWPSTNRPRRTDKWFGLLALFRQGPRPRFDWPPPAATRRWMDRMDSSDGCCSAQGMCEPEQAWTPRPQATSGRIIDALPEAT